jgi:hypothetical protein
MIIRSNIVTAFPETLPDVKYFLMEFNTPFIINAIRITAAVLALAAAAVVYYYKYRKR